MAPALLQGERDYTKLKGDTGPLVYPAGFVYLYSWLRWITKGGNVLRAQASLLTTGAHKLYLLHALENT